MDRFYRTLFDDVGLDTSHNCHIKAQILSVHPCKGIIKSAGHMAYVKSWQEEMLYDISSNKCWDPCSAVTCNADSACEVTSHRATCRDPCTPSPCGPFSQCSSRGTERCSCLPGHLGHPPHCRPECSGDTECPGYLACIRYVCLIHLHFSINFIQIQYLATSARIPVLEHHVDQTQSAGSPTTKLCVTASMDTGAIPQTVGADRSAPETASALATWPVSGN